MGSPGFGARYAPGPMPASRLAVLAVVEDRGREVGSVRYQVRLECCGRELVMTHQAIGRRVADVRYALGEGRELCCSKCARSGRRPSGNPRAPRRPYQPTIAQDYGVSAPEWPRPPSIAPGGWRWEDTR